MSDDESKNRKVAFPTFTRRSPHADGPSIERIITEGSKSMPEVWEGVMRHAEEVSITPLAPVREEVSDE